MADKETPNPPDEIAALREGIRKLKADFKRQTEQFQRDLEALKTKVRSGIYN